MSRAERLDAELRQRAATLIKDAMEAQGISQGQLAARLGISQSAISQMLRGTNNMTVATLAKLAAELGRAVTLDLSP